MTNSSRLESLVLDTLYDRRRTKSDSCLVVNEAGIELLKAGKEALPIIEQTITNIVVPKAEGAASGEAGMLGLTYVFGAYLVISSREGYDAAIPFLRRLPETLLESAMHAVHAFMRMMEDGYNFGVGPFEPLLAFLRELSRSPNPSLREPAVSYLKTREPGPGPKNL
jgi:hypothetical protein